MKTQRPIPVLPPSRPAPLSKNVSPTKARSKPSPQAAKPKPSVSASAIFKPRAGVAKKRTSTLKGIVGGAATRAALEDASVRKAPNVRYGKKDVRGSASRPRSGSPLKMRMGFAMGRGKSEMHPFALTFNETTTAYRMHLYRYVTTQLNSTHESLQSTLADLNMISYPASPDPKNPDASPLNLTLASAFHKVSEDLGQPFGDAILHLRRVDENGVVVPFHVTVEEKMTYFKDRIKESEEEIQELGARWESVVGEIWTLGCQVLGEDILSGILGIQSHTSSPSSEDEPLFVAEDKSSRPSGKKKVAFKDPLPDFLSQSSAFKSPVPALPTLPSKEVAEFKKQLDNLGINDIDELKRLEREHRKSWEQKQRKIVLALQG
ncbi:hypothetical protein K469DRAFT_183593 [Zopfia rhizophila CBS 207.26]|uniref:Uncharacterized protein n=1 Tax=Zopfia rhizophila CBS 207.26 TaxID=1314779 RepID=A0A6A6E144_9PEZI|nr:hypothetical protein K469DRAFT_183593 [Zopfia rhizophila CBS 207.26]